MRYALVILYTLCMVQTALPQEKPARIPVVKTWEELQALPPISLSDGVKIRLGLEADKVPQWSGALLYCLAEDYVPPSSGSGAMPFGPVFADIAYGDERELKNIKKKIDWGTKGKKPKGTYLYVRALQANRVGTCRIAVKDGQDMILANAKVESTKDFFHPWTPWLDGLDKPISPWEGIALPIMNDLVPSALIESGKTRKGRLPTLLPSDEKLTIKMDGNAIVIRAESAFTTSRPEQHFLARWWVNDKPFVQKQTDNHLKFAGYGLVSEAKEARVAFEFRPERLGAKPGDKIGLQLMHSEDGWAWCTGSSLSEHGKSRKNGENVRISNRIEFTVPNP